MTDAINKVEYYNPTLDKWYEAGPLKKSRSLVGVTVLRGTLYAVGSTGDILNLHCFTILKSFFFFAT